jgi:CRP-like cAMP-binding protein
MKKIVEALKHTGLFEGVEESEIEAMSKCLNVTKSRYSKGEYIYRCGECMDSVFVILSGNIQILKEDYWGNRAILAEKGRYEVIGTGYACANGERLDVSIMASEQSEVVFLEVGKVARTCPSSCEFHSRVIMNLLCILATDSLNLNGRLDRMAKRTTRDKISAFLSDHARKAGSNEFFITMNRQQMADHLGVDRSAMSSELGKMKKDGIIDFDKNHFILL